MIDKVLQSINRNYRILHQALHVVGKEFERKQYEELRKPAEELSFSRDFHGVTLHFPAEAYSVKPNGDLCFCIDATGFSTPLGVKPSYHFYKREDGSVYY